jgi:hypothetical protein
MGPGAVFGNMNLFRVLPMKVLDALHATFPLSVIGSVFLALI